MKIFGVKRYGKCIECGQIGTKYLGEYEAQTKTNAIERAIKEWSYDRFGQAGALRENELRIEEEFLNADFKAKETE